MTEFIEQNKEKITEAVKKMVGFMNLECQVELREELNPDNRINVVVSMYTPDNARFLIGKNGQNLKAFEHLIRSMFLKDAKETVGISVDVNDYRRSRAVYVVDQAKQAVSRVRNTQKAEVLLPMSAYERRVVHMELASCPDITTESIGDEPDRRIVVKPYPIK
jgi:spoIIIJ-associated protein